MLQKNIYLLGVDYKESVSYLHFIFLTSLVHLKGERIVVSSLFLHVIYTRDKGLDCLSPSLNFANLAPLMAQAGTMPLLRPLSHPLQIVETEIYRANTPKGPAEKVT